VIWAASSTHPSSPLIAPRPEPLDLAPQAIPITFSTRGTREARCSKRADNYDAFVDLIAEFSIVVIRALGSVGALGEQITQGDAAHGLTAGQVSLRSFQLVRWVELITGYHNYFSGEVLFKPLDLRLG
jgi:hypothetical protein